MGIAVMEGARERRLHGGFHHVSGTIARGSDARSVSVAITRRRLGAMEYARVGAVYLDTQTTRAPGIRPEVALDLPVLLFQAVPLLSQ